MRPLIATIHPGALRHNLGRVRQCAPQSRILAVVKANAYGHGLERACTALRDADGFAVLGLNEALALRAQGWTRTILLLEGVFAAEELALAAEHEIAVVVHHDRQIEMLAQTALPRPLAVFLKMNSGMNRLGFAPENYRSALSRLQVLENVDAITLMTHFATADEDSGIEEQLGVFNAATAGLGHARSLANSAAVLRHAASHADWVRPGIMLYGASPFADIPAAEFGLQPAMTLQSEIIAVQQLAPGQGVGYGQQFVAEQPTRVGVVACGYADGYPRHAPTGTPIAVAGQMTRTLGRVSMDMLCVDLTALPEANVGAPVELWGRQVPVDEVARAAGTVGYELLCAVAPRVPVEVGE
jgi:alanine racemase